MQAIHYDFTQGADERDERPAANPARAQLIQACAAFGAIVLASVLAVASIAASLPSSMAGV